MLCPFGYQKRFMKDLKAITHWIFSYWSFFNAYFLQISFLFSDSWTSWQQDNVNLSSWNFTASKLCLKIIKWCENWIKTAYRCGLWIAYSMLGNEMKLFTLYRLTRTFVHNTKLYYYDNQNKTIYTVCTFFIFYFYTLFTCIRIKSSIKIK